MGWKTLIAGAVMVLFSATAVQAAPATKAAPAAKPAVAAKPAATAAAPKAGHHHKHHRKHHKHHGMKAEATASAGAYASPNQPVAYALLDAYMKASPKERASRDWSGGATTAPVTTSQAPMAPAPTATQDTPPPAPATATSDTSVPPATAPPATP